MISWVFSSLDFFWNVLCLGTVAITILYSAGVILSSRYFKFSPRTLKCVWRLFYLQSFVILLCSTLYLVVSESSPLSCFEYLTGAGTTFSFTRIAATVWGLIAGGLFLLDAGTLILLRRRCREWVELKPGPLNRRVHEMAQTYLLRTPKIYIQSANQSPFVFGLLSPVVVLPQSGIQSLSEKSLDSVLAHEFSHIKEKDTLWGLVEYILKRLFFFHPLVYMAGGFYLDAQEKTADMLAIQYMRFNREDFVQSFFDVLALSREASSVPLSASSTSTFKALKSRIEFIKDEPRERSKWFSLVSIGVGTLASAGLAYAEVGNLIGLNAGEEQGIQMCLQVQQEAAIESLFKSPPIETNRCE